MSLIERDRHGNPLIQLDKPITRRLWSGRLRTQFENTPSSSSFLGGEIDASVYSSVKLEVSKTSEPVAFLAKHDGEIIETYMASGSPYTIELPQVEKLEISLLRIVKRVEFDADPSQDTGTIEARLVMSN